MSAVILGVKRVTSDLDRMIELPRESFLAAIERLLSIGLEARGPVDPPAVAHPIYVSLVALQRRATVNVLRKHRPARAGRYLRKLSTGHQTLQGEASRVGLDGLEVRLASLAHLVRMRRVAHRPKDIEDVRALGLAPEVVDGDEP